jgi:hypothetical protein
MWGSGGIAPTLLTSALDGGERSASLPGLFTSGESAPSIHWIGRRPGGPQSRSGRCEEKKNLSLPGIEPLAAQPVARR